jgi:branched-chain amino acid transport system permease protein
MSRAIVDARQGLNRALAPINAAVSRNLDRREVRFTLLGLLLVFVLLFPHLPYFSDSVQVDAATEAETFILLALGLNIVIGYAGLLDLGYAAFFAIGALTMAWLASPHFTVTSHSFSSPFLSFGSNGVFVNFFLMIPVAAIAAAFCGVLFGAPTLRLRGDYLAIVTLAFGEIVPRIMQNLGPNNTFNWPDITGGVNAIVGIEVPPSVNVFGIHADFQGSSLNPWYYLGLILVVFSIIVIRNLRESKLGRAWAAIREDEIAAAHMGINITRTRLLAFGLGAAFSGFGGMFEASRLGSVFYTTFSFNVSIFILVMVILGGMGSIPGAIIGAIILSYLNLLWLKDISDFINNLGGKLEGGPLFIGSIGNWMHNVDLATASPLIFGIILVLTMLLRPQGLWPSRTRARELQPETSEILEEEDTELYTVRAE